MSTTKPYQPKTGQRCHCKRGQQRDNCPDCEGTGWRIDFAAIRARSTKPLIARKNWNCDNDQCQEPHGEVRVLPAGGQGNLILCQACFLHELRYRQERNRAVSVDCQFELPAWDSLKVYAPALT